jgi:hypothetical protein
MTKIKLQNNIYLFIECDNDSHSHSLTKFKKHAIISYKRNLTGNTNWSENIGGLNFELLNYEIISTTKNITEEQTGNIVEKYEGKPTDFEEDNFFMYKDYIENIDNEFYTAKESLQSLIQASGLNVNKNYLILKKYDRFK